MPTYCTDTQLTDRLPDNLSTAVDAEGERAFAITEASAWADIAVGPNYAYSETTQKFPDVSADPSNGEYLQIAVAWYAASLILLKEGHEDRQIPAAGEEDEGVNAEERKAQRMLRMVREGTVVLANSNGATFRSATISHGQSNAEPDFRYAKRDRDGDLVGTEQPGTLDSYHGKLIPRDE